MGTSNFRDRVLYGLLLIFSTLVFTKIGGNALIVYLGCIYVVSMREVLQLYSLLKRNQKMFGVLLGLMLTFLPVCLIALGQKVYILYGIVWASDTSALLAGKFFGGSKLLMSISPQKTVSGFCGAIFGGGVVGWALGGGLEVSLALAAISQVGDLAESAIKRCADLKDSDVWFRIPGHGGFLDRIDALILAAPFAYIFFYN